MNVNWEAVTREAVGWLQDLIRLNSENPPRDEAAAAVYVRDTLKREGIVAQAVGPTPLRLSAVAGLPGSSEGGLLFVSHLDTVPAPPAGWSADPFAGEERDGFIWGRGALDCKGRTAAHMAVLMLAKRLGLPLRRDLRLAACADEEMGGRHGAGWLVAHHPEMVAADLVIGEGGGLGLPVGDRFLYTCAVAEKGHMQVLVQISGAGGHASIPRDDNPVLLISRLLLALADLPSSSGAVLPGALRQFISVLRPELSPTAARQLDRLAGAPVPPASGTSGELQEFLPILLPMLRDTVVPTRVWGGTGGTSVPAQAGVELDCRLLPGVEPAEFTRRVERFTRHLLPSVRAEFTWTMLNEPSASPADTPLFSAIGEALAAHRPGSRLAPYVLSGATDLRFFRSECRQVYGFHPLHADLPLAEMYRLTHGVDERLSVANLEFAIRVLFDVVLRTCL